MGAYELVMTQCSSLSAHPKIAILKSWGQGCRGTSSSAREGAVVGGSVGIRQSPWLDSDSL